MAATPYRNRRAYSETSPNLTNFGRESGNQQRSFSTSDISPESLEEGSVFDFSPLPTDLPETSPTNSDTNVEKRNPAPVDNGGTAQQIPVEVSDFILRRQIESENERLGSLTETESVATRIRTDLHIETNMHDFSDFLDELWEFDLHHNNSSAGGQPTTVESNPSLDNPLLVSTRNSTSNSVPGTHTDEASNGTCLYASNSTSVREAWSTQTPLLYSSSELGFDYHSHLNSNHGNTNNGFQAPSQVTSPFSRALDLSNISTPSCSQSSMAVNSGNISPSSTASYSLSERSSSAQATSHPQAFQTSWDSRQRSQCLLPVQNVQRNPLRPTDPSSNRTNLDKEGGSQGSQGQKTSAHPSGVRKKRATIKDKWCSRSSATGTEKPLPNEKNHDTNHSQAAEGATGSTETSTANPTTSDTDKTPNGGAIQEQDITSSSSETTTNMLPFTEEIAMLNADNVSIFEQFEPERHFQDFDIFQQQNMMPQQDFSMGEKQNTMAQPMASPMSPPEGNMFTPDATFLELENYYYPNQASPASTELSEQEMSEAYEIVMEDILSSITPRLGISTDPTQWSQEQVQAWISLLIQEYCRQEVNLNNFQVNGFTLSHMTQEELEQRAPGNGDLLHSTLKCLTKSIQREDVKPVLSPYQHQQFHQQQPQQQAPPPPPPPMGYDPNMMYQYPMTSMAPPSPAATVSERGHSPSPAASSSDEEEASMSSPARSPTGPNTSMTPHHTGSIQLWQFLQELLLQPDSYNYCIRFLDRSQGIFKIEDSVEVARLWGMRKNRPAMNYDKLSRSIRQYYRKGIMKKTEISQRLVYQFVTPF